MKKIFAVTLLALLLLSGIVGARNFDTIYVDGVSRFAGEALWIGTTSATAATSVSIDFDEAVTGVGSFAIGTIGVAQVLNEVPGVNVVPMSLNVQHSQTASTLTDYIGFYNKIDFIGVGGASVTAVGNAVRAYVGLAAGANDTVLDELYASQPWVKHEGTGAITAMSGLSAKCDVSADAFTATTVNGGHFHIEGAATVTSAYFDGVLVEVYGDVTDMDAGMRVMVDGAATVADGYALTGLATDGIDLSGATLTNDIVLSGTQIIDSEALGAIVAAKCTAVEYQGTTQKTILTFTLTGDNDLDLPDGHHGTGIKVFDMPEGRILILGATINASVTTSDNYNASSNDVFVVSMGTVLGADDNSLTGTEVDIIPSTELDTVGGTSLTLAWGEALAASAQFDGTTTPVDLYVNAAIANTSNDGANTYAITGTVTITWVNLGDY